MPSNQRPLNSQFWDALNTAYNTTFDSHSYYDDKYDMRVSWADQPEGEHNWSHYHQAILRIADKWRDVFNKPVSAVMYRTHWAGNMRIEGKCLIIDLESRTTGADCGSYPFATTTAKRDSK